MWLHAPYAATMQTPSHTHSYNPHPHTIQLQAHWKDSPWAEQCFASTGIELVCPSPVQAFIEDAFWQNYRFDAEALAALPAETFKDSLIIKDSIGYRRKYLWDFFNPHYSCPLKEKIGILAVRFCL